MWGGVFAKACRLDHIIRVFVPTSFLSASQVTTDWTSEEDKLLAESVAVRRAFIYVSTVCDAR